ncbi:MAG: carotenoid oxygenase family protein [Pleurocapsa sp.]
MVTVSKPKAWSKSVIQPASEFSLTSLPILAGAIPPKLRGKLYRNGPARLSRGDRRVGHWFDGDGAILGVNFTDEGATGVYRYVQTQGYQDETAADAFLYPNYGMKAPGAFWNNWFKPVKNSANTSVLALPDCLLALWEGGLPYALDLVSLKTLNSDRLAGFSNKQTFSAHPKVDPDTGEIFNFGVSAGLNATLNLYRCDRSGQLQQQNTFSLKGLPLIHDFVLAGQYLVFLVSPVRVNLASVMLGQKSYSDAMEWKPELGTKILIFERDNLSLVSSGQTDPWYQWHFSNGCVADGAIALELVRYENFQTNQYLKEVATGKIETPARGTLWSFKIDPQTAEVIESKQLVDRDCEFPTIAPHRVGKSWRYTYLSVRGYGDDSGRELLTAIAAYDHHIGNLFIADMGANCYPSEPILVPSTADAEKGWLLTVVYDGNQDSSEVRIYQSDRLFEPPICRLGLPIVIPPSFHGTWKSS